MSSPKIEKQKNLSVGHNIFISREQRYLLRDIGAEIKVLGVSIPKIYKKKGNEIIDEVFVEYLIRCVEAADSRFVLHNDRYELQLVPSMTKHLLDLRDGGIECLIFANHSGIKRNDEVMHCVHYVSIQDEKVLKDSLE